MTSYYVKKETDCPNCDGHGIIQTASWREYFSSVDWRHDTDESRLAWFERGGYLIDGQLPPEEEDCPVCDGLGVLIESVLLLDALRDLNITS